MVFILDSGTLSVPHLSLSPSTRQGLALSVLDFLLKRMSKGSRSYGTKNECTHTAPPPSPHTDAAIGPRSLIVLQAGATADCRAVLKVNVFAVLSLRSPYKMVPQRPGRFWKHWHRGLLEVSLS